MNLVFVKSGYRRSGFRARTGRQFERDEYINGGKVYERIVPPGFCTPEFRSGKSFQNRQVGIFAGKEDQRRLWLEEGFVLLGMSKALDVDENEGLMFLHYIERPELLNNFHKARGDVCLLCRT